MGGVSEEYLNSCVTLNSLVRIYHVKTSKAFSADEEKKVYLDAARNEVETARDLRAHARTHIPRTRAVFSLYLYLLSSPSCKPARTRSTRAHTRHTTHIKHTHTHPRPQAFAAL